MGIAGANAPRLRANNQPLLDARREELGLSKIKAAAALGVHRNTLNAYLEQKPLK